MGQEVHTCWLPTYTFTNTEGLVKYLFAPHMLQDHSIATEKAAGFHTTAQVSLIRKRKKWFLVSVHQSSLVIVDSPYT